jgi:type IV pilus assembly protein PilM
MAKRTKNLVGLDIDPSGLTAVEVAVDGRIIVRRAASAPLDNGILRDGEVADVEGLSAALRDLWKQNGSLGKRVRVGVANQKMVVRVMEMPQIDDPKQLDTAVRFHAQDHLPMPLESAVLDYQPLSIVEADGGRRMRVMLVAARREMIDRLLAAVRGAGLRPEGVDLSAFAMVRALCQASEGDAPTLYLAIGGLTNLAVCNGATCTFTRAVGAGIEALAIELAERQSLTLEHAREWLAHVGLREPIESIDGDSNIVADARQVLLKGVRRIAADVRNTLDFHRAQGAAEPVGRAIVTGPVTAIPGFAEVMASELGLPVEAGAVDGAPDGLEPGRLTVAAGLAVAEAVS